MRHFVLLSLALAACVDPDEKPDDTDPIEAPEDADADGFTVAEGDCDDTDGARFPGAVEACDGIDQDCDDEVDDGVGSTWYTDLDGDGFGDDATATVACDGDTAEAGDCDDADPDVYPDAPEVCDDVDQDCDGEVDEGLRYLWYADADGDGHGDPATAQEVCEAPGGTTVGDDCDDTTALAFPGNVETCDEIDNDCDGTVDEDVQATWFVDLDEDGYGDAGLTQEACDAPTGYAANADDCDDATPAVNPAAAESCNAVDDDCDGTIDEADAVDAPTWYGDADGDGAGDPAAATVACAAPPGTVAEASDCDDGDAALHPATAWYIDYDADGYGSTAYTLAQCTQPAGYVRDTTDCDDARAASNPAATEACNAVDDDCDGTVDEADAVDASAWYADTDGDGYGDAAAVEVACDVPAGHVDDAADCDDTDAGVSPADVEVCGGADEDCDGLVDDADPDVTRTAEWFDDLDGDGAGDVSGAPTLACDAPAGTAATADDCDDGDASAVDCASCAEILDRGLDIGDALYTIDPSGGAPFDVYCDMTTSGGGWTLLGVYGTGTGWTSTSVTDATSFGSASLTADHKSEAWSTIPFADLLFEDDTLWAEYDDMGDGTEDYYTFQAAIPVHNCGTRSGYAWTMDAGNLTGGTLCNTTLYMHPIDWDGGVNSACSATFVNANNGFGPTWSVSSNNGCPLDDPSVSGFYAGGGGAPWGTPLRMWAR